MKKVTLILTGLIMAACQTDPIYFVESEVNTSSNVEITIIHPMEPGLTNSTSHSKSVEITIIEKCQTCADMLKEGYDYRKNNFCENSLETWQEFSNKICTDSSPCFLDCEDVFCTWQSPMTEICKSCVMDAPYGIIFMQKCLSAD